MKPVKIYTTPVCGYCVAAKRFLEKNTIPFEEVDVSDDYETRRWLVARTGQRTVPQIFIGDTSVGGYTDLRALAERGQLEPLLDR